MSYRDKGLQRRAVREATRRYRGRKRGIAVSPEKASRKSITEGITVSPEKVLQGITGYDYVVKVRPSIPLSPRVSQKGIRDRVSHQPEKTDSAGANVERQNMGQAVKHAIPQGVVPTTYGAVEYLNVNKQPIPQAGEDV